MVEGNNEETVHHAVSFAAQNTYLGLPQMKVYNSINIRLQFRTFEQNGLLFFNAGKASDFIALELVNGRLNYILNLGYGPISIKDNTDIVSIMTSRSVSGELKKTNKKFCLRSKSLFEKQQTCNNVKTFIFPKKTEFDFKTFPKTN